MTSFATRRLQVLRTARLSLRPVGVDDVDLLAGLYGDSQVTAFTKLGRRGRSQTRDIVAGYLDTWRLRGVDNTRYDRSM